MRADRWMNNGCAQYVKDTIWKQFTTHQYKEYRTLLLCSIRQRYNLKAIHNLIQFVLFKIIAVLNTSKIQFESNSQPMNHLYKKQKSCAQYVKDTIWKQFTTDGWSRHFGKLLCSIRQRYNLKAIHNFIITFKSSISAVLNTSKIQFESNSQQESVSKFRYSCCAQYVKDTIWKQFTTINLRGSILN